LVFPADYPFKPPAIRMMTPSGRFKTNTRLCLSISDYHPKSWNPAWSVSTILTGLLSFMVSDESTAGSITTSDEQKKRCSKESQLWNLKNNAGFREHFEHKVADNEKIVIERQRTAAEEKLKASQALSSAQSYGQKSTVSVPVVTDIPRRGFSSRQKMLCVLVVVASWILASRLFEVLN
jgi:ubiquitin-conjugating enzyme E2 J2